MDEKMYNEIKNILIQDWDPIGIGNNPYLQDEYDIYINNIIKLLIVDANINCITDYLKTIENDYIGTNTNSRIRYKIASALKNIYIKR